MEISQLQSIIKRQASHIAQLEGVIGWNFQQAKYFRYDGDFDMASSFSDDAHQHKRKLKKLVSLQKALKKEIAFEIGCMTLEQEFCDYEESLTYSGLPTWLLGQAQ